MTTLPNVTHRLICAALLLGEMQLGAAEFDAAPVSHDQMQAIYQEVKTPYKHGIVLEPPVGKKVDCPCVFHYDNKWYMVYVELQDPPQQGYETHLAQSDDLLNWQSLGAILSRGGEDTWDQANAGGGVALFDTSWGGNNQLHSYDGHYWLTYLGGRFYGYEKTPLSIGVAFTNDPSARKEWSKAKAPVLSPADPDARIGERGTLYKSYAFADPTKSLGSQFVMFYNAKEAKGSEQIFMAVSDDLRIWRRFGSKPVISNADPTNPERGVISGDPQVVRIGDVWVMFYFGAFWKPGAFDTFAASKDLIHWTKWDGEDLIKPSESYDTSFAHKPWLIKHRGVVYHFYCAVGGKDQHRAIAVATSKKL